MNTLRPSAKLVEERSKFIDDLIEFLKSNLTKKYSVSVNSQYDGIQVFYCKYKSIVTDAIGAFLESKGFKFLDYTAKNSTFKVIFDKYWFELVLYYSRSTYEYSATCKIHNVDPQEEL